MSSKKVPANARPTEPGDEGIRPGDASGAHRHPAVQGGTGRPTLLSRIATVVRRMPFTTAVVLVILAVGVATGSLWTPISERTWFPDAAYGLPSLTEGAWWTPLTGSLLALSPVFYVPVIASFLLFVGFAEWRLGSRRTALICVAGQLVAVLGAALTLLALRHSGWDWAETLALTRDAGFSAGALACITVATAAMRSPWRLRVRAGLVLYVTVSFLFAGTLADLEHLWAVAVALPLSRLLAGGHAVGAPGGLSISRREWRLLAAIGLALIAIGEVVLLLVPAPGLLGPGAGVQPPGWCVSLAGAVVVVVLNGVRHGRRWAWWGAMAIGAFNVVGA